MDFDPRDYDDVRDDESLGLRTRPRRLAIVTTHAIRSLMASICRAVWSESWCRTTARTCTN